MDIQRGNHAIVCRPPKRAEYERRDPGFEDDGVHCDARQLRETCLRHVLFEGLERPGCECGYGGLRRTADSPSIRIRPHLN